VQQTPAVHSAVLNMKQGNGSNSSRAATAKKSPPISLVYSSTNQAPPTIKSS